MPDAGYNGQGEIRHVLGERKGVETGEVARRAATTDNHHAVPAVTFGIDTVEGCYHALLHSLALHGGREEFGAERKTVFVVGELVTEVAVARRRSTRHHGDALAEHGQGEFFLQVEHALLFQRAHYLHALAHHVAHGIVGVDVLHYP